MGACFYLELQSSHFLPWFASMAGGGAGFAYGEVGRR